MPNTKPDLPKTTNTGEAKSAGTAAQVSHVLVPGEPTYAMILAASLVVPDWPIDSDAKIIQAYKAMLAAKEAKE